jgi:hypothetical protein
MDAYEEIIATIDSDKGGLFFMDGRGGTGKTFLYKSLLATLRSQNKLAMPTATSGVATSMLLKLKEMEQYVFFFTIVLCCNEYFIFIQSTNDMIYFH